MEKYNFKYNAKKSLPKRAHVGVVGSGDLEVLMASLTAFFPAASHLSLSTGYLTSIV